MAGRQQQAPAVGPFDHEVDLALVPLAPNHPDQPSREGMVRRRHPNPFYMAGTKLLSLSVGV